MAFFDDALAEGCLVSVAPKYRVGYSSADEAEACDAFGILRCRVSRDRAVPDGCIPAVEPADDLGGVGTVAADDAVVDFGIATDGCNAGAAVVARIFIAAGQGGVAVDAAIAQFASGDEHGGGTFVGILRAATRALGHFAMGCDAALKPQGISRARTEFGVATPLKENIADDAAITVDSAGGVACLQLDAV